MRLPPRRGLAPIALVIVTALLACGNHRRALVRDPASVHEPAPHRAFHDPSVRGPHDQTASAPSGPRSPYEYPTAPGAALTAPPPAALPEPERKRPPYPEAAPREDRTLAKVDRPLTEGEVIGAVALANDGEVALAELALERANAPAVRKFAEKLKREHADAAERARGLQVRTKIDGVESDASNWVRDELGRATKALLLTQGEVFDRAYVSTEVKRHAELLALLDDRLAPAAKNAELAALVAGMRQELIDHLAKAEELLEELDPSSIQRGRTRQSSE